MVQTVYVNSSVCCCSCLNQWAGSFVTSANIHTTTYSRYIQSIFTLYTLKSTLISTGASPKPKAPPQTNAATRQQKRFKLRVCGRHHPPRAQPSAPWPGCRLWLRRPDKPSSAPLCWERTAELQSERRGWWWCCTRDTRETHVWTRNKIHTRFI